MNKPLLSTNYKTIPAQSQVYRGSIPVLKIYTVTLCNKGYTRYKDEGVATSARRRSAEAQERKRGDI